MDYGKGARLTKKITVYGIVQGVGFRPLVYHIAQKYNIRGTVRNVGGIVEIIAQGSAEDYESFFTELSAADQGGCEIVRIETEDIHDVEYSDFKIIGSGLKEQISIIPPDLPVCPDCQRELYTDHDRRAHNPFISCMSCGPRYTVIEELPYDRENTTMQDYDMCDACLEEYTSPESRRFHAQTISCNDCGPFLIYRGRKLQQELQEKVGYSDSLPEEITECNALFAEMVHQDAIECELMEQEALHAAVKLLKEGGVIAVKGIGGYHFVCSPFLEQSVQRLRSLKGREEKPFAVMFENMASIEEYCFVSKEERWLLESKARPIVLLYSREYSADRITDVQADPAEKRNAQLAECNAGITECNARMTELNHRELAPSTNMGSIYCGAFLPYTPLQLELTRLCGPLIMTSANRSDQPIIREDEVMLSIDSPYLDGVLYHTRRIVRSVDDSVAKILHHKPQLIRRSRGYVPYPVFLQNTRQELPVFAAGGDLKAAYCLYRKGQAVVAQHFGDLEELTVMQEYEASREDLSRLLKLQPELAVCDLHPNYYSSHYARSLGIPVLEVQHHHAHVASVIAEHQLTGPVIGIAFDGTGYGTDGNIWGGEFLVCEHAGFTRAAHLAYTPIIGGDRSMKDAAKTAACFLIQYGLEEYLREDRKEIIKAAVKNRVNTVLTSSMGRLFDAVSSILNIAHENRYEGECAIRLEKEAVLMLRRLSGQNRREEIGTVEEWDTSEWKKTAVESGIEKTVWNIRDWMKQEGISFVRESDSGILINPGPVLSALCRLRDTVDTGILALSFHYAVADMITEVCIRLREEVHSNIVALSGGVFQNSVLTERVIILLEREGFRVYVNEAVPPNDGSISLGQTYLGLMQ